MAALREQQVEVELSRQALVHSDARVVEARALGGLVVRAQDRRVAARGARADVALLEHRDVPHAELAEVVRRRQAVRAAADDHDVVAVAQLAAPAPHPPGPEDLTQAEAPSARRRRPDLHRGGRPRPRPPPRGTRRAPIRRARATAARPRAARIRASARPTRDGSPRPGSLPDARRSRRTAPAARARPGPISASAASPQVTSTTVTGRPLRASARRRRRRSIHAGQLRRPARRAPARATA